MAVGGTVGRELGQLLPDPAAVTGDDERLCLSVEADDRLVLNGAVLVGVREQLTLRCVLGRQVVADPSSVALRDELVIARVVLHGSIAHAGSPGQSMIRPSFR